jgi:hypothetical protein
MEKNNLKNRVLMSIRRSLQGEETPNLLGVSYKLTENKLNIVSYFNVEISEEIEESVMDAETEVMADFEDFEIDWKAIQVSSEEEMKSLGDWIYQKDNN